MIDSNERYIIMARQILEGDNTARASEERMTWFTFMYHLKMTHLSLSLRIRKYIFLFEIFYWVSISRVDLKNTR